MNPRETIPTGNDGISRGLGSAAGATGDDRPVLVLDGDTLTCDALVKAARGEMRIAVADTVWARIRAGRDVVDQMVESGASAYGITTGVGSQKDYAVSSQDAAEYNARLVAAHATRVPGPLLKPHSVRAAMIVLVNQYTRGFSGVSEALVHLIVDRANATELPEVDASGSVGASDLVPLAQIAHWLLSSPEAKAAGLPRAKETLSLINCNAVTLAVGANALLEARRLMAAFDLAAAAALEGFRGNLDAISECVNATHRRPGQHRAAGRIRAFLAGSRLWMPAEARLLQDPLSFRCVSQAHGAAHELVDRALSVWNDELNSVNDNPIVDQEIAGVRSNGNMDTTRFTLAIDGLRQALAKVADLAGERLHKQQWPAFSGLPTGLAEEASAIGGVQFLNLGHIGASIVTSAKIWARPHLLISVGQVADGVEDTAGHALHAVHDLERLIEAGWKIATIETAVAVWAMRRRRLTGDSLGRGVRVAYDRIGPMLPVGTEGREVFNLGPLIAAFQEDNLVEEALAAAGIEG